MTLTLNSDRSNVQDLLKKMGFTCTQSRLASVVVDIVLGPQTRIEKTVVVYFDRLVTRLEMRRSLLQTHWIYQNSMLMS